MTRAPKKTTTLSESRRNPFRDNYTEPKYHAYALAIGQLALAWNDLHGVLALLFWDMLGGGDSGVPLSVWNSQISDAAQRAMLRDAVKAKLSLGGHPPQVQARRSTAKDDIEWLIKAVNDLGQEGRNPAIHSPLASVGLGKCDGSP
jgi:hypothetical protein